MGEWINKMSNCESQPTITETIKCTVDKPMDQRYRMDDSRCYVDPLHGTYPWIWLENLDECAFTWEHHLEQHVRHDSALSSRNRRKFGYRPEPINLVKFFAHAQAPWIRYGEPGWWAD